MQKSVMRLQCLGTKSGCETLLLEDPCVLFGTLVWNGRSRAGDSLGQLVLKTGCPKPARPSQGYDKLGFLGFCALLLDGTFGVANGTGPILISKFSLDSRCSSDCFGVFFRGFCLDLLIQRL
jgi:hypothetical protein